MSLTLRLRAPGERFEILGFPQVELEVSSDQPNALVVVRLCEVFADGTSTLVSRALHNLHPSRIRRVSHAA